jgi:hypothetical protein
LPITISYHGKPSNKAQTLTKNSEVPYLKKLKFSHLYGEAYPRIDKITITLDGSSSEDEAHIRAAAFASLDDKEWFVSAKKSPDYQIAANIICGKSGRRAYFNCSPKPGKKRPFCRLEFNPDQLGQIGLQGLHVALNSIMPNGFHYVLAQGRVSKVDIAVDIPKLRMDQFLALPPQGLTYQRWSREGHVETIYLGSSHGNQTRIYDKGKQLKKHEHLSILGHLVRVERTLRPNSKLKFADLPNIANPFLDLTLTKTMSAIPGPPTKKDARLWAMFAHSVQVGDLAVALPLLSPSKRTLFRAHFEANVHPLWNPDAIWMHWPKMLAKLGMFNPTLFP